MWLWSTQSCTHPLATGSLSEPPTEVEQCTDDEQGGSQLQDLLPVDRRGRVTMQTGGRVTMQMGGGRVTCTWGGGEGDMYMGGEGDMYMEGG